MQSNFKLNELPPNVNLETIAILKKLNSAHRALAELKGIASTIPNQEILINTLSLQEAKDSSAVENIITTHDELYKAELNFKGIYGASVKEVQSYSYALKLGYDLVVKDNMLTNKHILNIQSALEKNDAGFRKVSGTSLKNVNTGEVVYTPPQDYDSIVKLMSNLEKYININNPEDPDILVKMAVIHYQFESIHPFYDGNGRTGRIINILYLVLNSVLNLPILYLSRYIIKNKADYYLKLQNVRDNNDWESFILFMLDAIEETSIDTIDLIKQINSLMNEYKYILKNDFKFYSKELLNSLFYHPYTKIEFISESLGVSRITSANYLNQLSEKNLLQKVKLGKSNYYINNKLFDLLSSR